MENENNVENLQNVEAENNNENQNDVQQEQRYNLRIRANLKPPNLGEDFIYDFDDYENLYLAQVNNEPNNYKKAIKSDECDKWKEAMKDEILALAQNKTWILVNKPEDTKVLSNRWVFKVKESSELGTRYRARLVAKGYEQVEGIDFTDFYSPVARNNSIRIFLAIVASEKLFTKQFDVKSAFLNGSLTETIYMKEFVY